MNRRKRSSRVAPAVLVLALAAIACAEDLPALAPFPCAMDGTCPSGYDCTAANQCVTTLSCGGGQLDCRGVCVTPASDRENCGSCGVPCAAGAVCCNGGCCASDSCCGPVGGQACADLQTDANHCSSCDEACPTNDACKAGSCVCEPPHEICAGACADTSADSNNCGMCGHVCTGDDTCQGGTCQCERCGGAACVAISTDPKNCGGCGVVSPTGLCQNRCPVETPASVCSQGPLCGCGDGQNCVFVLPGGYWTCLSAGSIPLGGTCEIDEQCEAGLSCSGDARGLPHHCQAYCNLPGDPCPAGQVCCGVSDVGPDGGSIAGSQSNSCFPGTCCF